MYHNMQFDPSLIKERHDRMRAEASKRRLVKQLRKHHKGSGPRLVAYLLRLTSALHALRGPGSVRQ
jgi:hypothetical protein